MQLANVPKNGRAKPPQEECRKLVLLLPSRGNTPSPMLALSPTQVYTKPLEPAAGSSLDWAGEGNPNPGKRETGSKCPEDAISEGADQRGQCPLLPLIKRGGERDTGARKRNPGRFAEGAPQPKPSQKQVKVKSGASRFGDMTPWVKPSPSETSLTALLGSLDSPRTCAGNLELLPSPSDTNPALNQKICKGQTSPPALQLLRERIPSRVKPRSRAGVTKRRTLHKLHSMKLPPVPAITELSFSRNFSFSFFELPAHQSPQHWLQRQKVVYMTMRQLQY